MFFSKSFKKNPQLTSNKRTIKKEGVGGFNMKEIPLKSLQTTKIHQTIPPMLAK